MGNQYWIVKQEPSSYSWADFVQEGRTAWTGVRNFAARNHLRTMRKSDRVLFYHSGEEKQVVGVAKVAREFFPDPTAKEGDWSAVELVPVEPLPKPVSLQTIKSDKSLKDIMFVRQSRLSVSPLTEEQYRHILTLAGASA
jgi:predicted RNA-binding protein with PUA-like domain